MKLYYAPGACSLSPHIVAREGGLSVDLSRVTFDGAKRTTAEGEDFFVVNPKGGYVPTLRLDDGEVLTEGVAIVQYFADQAPSKNLMPKHGTKEYYRELEWLTFISSEIHKGFSPLFNPALSENDKTAVVDKLKKRFTYLDGALTGKEYLLGDTFSIADAYCYTILRWSPRGSIKIAEYPNLSAFVDRMEAREAVHTALTEEGLEPLIKN
jgi:glutathione S-transferase